MSGVPQEVDARRRILAPAMMGDRDGRLRELSPTMRPFRITDGRR